MMRTKILLAATCLLCVLAAEAQDKAWRRSATMKEFRTAMKEKRYDDAKGTIDKAFGKWAEAREDAQLHSMKTEALVELLTVENRKIYLNQKPDTAKYFNLVRELYNTGMRCDTLELAAYERLCNSLSDQRKAPKPAKAIKYRKSVAARLLPYRDKLSSAGRFFYNKKDYAQAYSFFDLYISTASSPVFSDIELSNTQDVSALATLSAFGSGNHAGVMRHLAESLMDTQLEGKLLEIGSKSAAAVGDTATMVYLLEDGFLRHTTKTDYFFLTLTKLYNEQGRYADALAKAVRMTELFPANRDYFYIRGKDELLLQMHDSALVSFGRCVELKPDDAESYASIGSIYLQKAHEQYAAQGAQASPEQKRGLAQLYALAGENFEAAQKFLDDNPSLWLEGLREVYFKLNKGKELKALDKHLPKR